MLKPTHPLGELIDEYHKDVAIRETTARTYANLHSLFLTFLREGRSIPCPTLGDLSHENALAFAKNFRPKDRRAGRYRERNALISLKALAKWLAEKRLWYESRAGEHLSVLRDVRLPPIPALGRKPFTDREVKDILEAIPKVSRFPLRERAIMTLEVSAPIRPDEVRRLLLRDFHPAERQERGHLLVRDSKTEAGTDRVIPLDEEAENAIRSYLRFERPQYSGEQPPEFADQEPLFLTDEGSGFTYNGWASRNRLLRQALEKAGITDFVQYRSRGYAAKRLQKAGTPLQVIMQVGGWKREAMPTRYIGKYDEGELKAFPTANLRSLLRSG